MKKTLSKQPLVLTALQLRYSDVPGLSQMQPQLLDDLHKAMLEEGFQEKIISPADIFETSFDPSSQQSKLSIEKRNRYLFRAEGERTIVEILSTTIILKTTNYDTFENFYSMFERLLNCFAKLVPNFNKSLIKSVGIRYVDVIVPTDEHELTDFVVSDILPPKIESIPGEHLHGTTSKIIKTDQDQSLRIVFEQLPCNDGKVHKILPDDLSEPEQKCSIKILGFETWLSVRSPTYGILDIDHTFKFSRSPVFNFKSIETATKKLYEHTSNVFWNVTTETAQNAWGVKEIDS
jgi:uncharacterized protein (TIGR04255 family)